MTVLDTWNVYSLNKRIGYNGQATIVWASYAKLSLASEKPTSPNVKLLAIG